jgi:hypothetical protein
MRTGSGEPRRTEDELRAALPMLERHAPSAEAVLRAVRDSGGRRAPALPWTLRARRSARWRVLALSITAAAAAVAVVIAVLPGGAASHRGGPRAGQAPGSGSASAAAVGKAMLAAFGAAQDDILYSTQTGLHDGVVVDIYQDWSWPAQPVTGRLTRWREKFTERISQSRPLKLTEDDSFVYTTTPGGANTAYGQLTVVCYAGSGQTGCGYGNTETPAGTWSLHRGRFVNPNPGLDDLSPAALARGIIKGQWRVAGRTRLHGRQAIKLTETPAGSYMPLPTVLWVDARTHLPLRMNNGAGKSWAQSDWSYLKPTAANRALLRVPVPAGYRRVNHATG